MKNNLVYIKEFLLEFKTTGTICPSSKFLAEALTRPLEGTREPKRILEAGPGTGVITQKILERMIDGDELAICEINHRFMEELKNKLSTNQNFIRHKNRVSFFEGPIQEFPSDKALDVIISSLPFLNFDVKTVEEIFEKLKELSNENTVMTYIEYIGLRPLGKVFSPPERKQRLKELDTFFKQFSRKHQIDRERIWLNVLPSNVYTLQLAA